MFSVLLLLHAHANLLPEKIGEFINRKNLKEERNVYAQLTNKYLKLDSTSSNLIFLKLGSTSESVNKNGDVEEEGLEHFDNIERINLL